MSEWISSVASMAGIDVTSPASSSPSVKSTVNGGGLRKSFASQYQNGSGGSRGRGSAGRSQQTAVPSITEVYSDDDEEGQETTPTAAAQSDQLQHGSPSVMTKNGSSSFVSMSGMKRENSNGTSTPTATVTPPGVVAVQYPQNKAGGMLGRKPPLSLPLGPVLYQPPQASSHQDPTQQMRGSNGTSPVTEGMTRTNSNSGNITTEVSGATGTFPATSGMENQALNSARSAGMTSNGRGSGFYNYSLSHVPPLALTSTAGNCVGPLQLKQLQLMGSARGPGSARSSIQSANVTRMRRPCANVLVLGSRQVGKSAFVNAYRAVNTASAKWPIAPVGMCGRHGTTAVDPCPNNSMSPGWILVDTPGRVYSELHRRSSTCVSVSRSNSPTSKPRGGSKEGESDGTLADSPKLRTLDVEDPSSNSNYDGDDAVLLQLLFEGLPWKTRLVGPKCASLSSLTNAPPTPSNRAHHAVVVLSATDIVTLSEGSGLGGWFGLSTKFVAAPQLDSLRSHLADFLEYVRVLLSDSAPFIVVTHMDSFPLKWRQGAETRIKAELKNCVPLNRMYFMTLPNGANASDGLGGPSQGTGSPLSLSKQMEGVAPSDSGTKTQLLKLHHDLQCDLAWFYKTASDLQSHTSESFASSQHLLK